METWQGVVLVVVLGIAIVVVASIADACREHEEAQWQEPPVEEAHPDTITFIEQACGRIYKDLDPRRKGRMVRVLDVTWVSGVGWMCSVLARPSGVVSDIRWDRLEDPARFERVPSVREV